MCPDPAFPYFFSPSEFLEILTRDSVQFLDESQDPQDFVGLFRFQRVKEYLDWTLSALCAIENDVSTHFDKLTRTLTKVNRIKRCLPDFSLAALFTLTLYAI